MNTNNFDKLAPFYDFLARLPFGNSIRNSQTVFFNTLKPNSKVLILGGGTGWILKEILQAEPSVKIEYVEKSMSMIKRAQKGLSLNHQAGILFTHNSFEEWECDEKFDSIFCNFFLDVFSEKNLNDWVVSKLKRTMSPGAKLFVTDFQQKGSGFNLVWQRILLWVMHRFFRLTANLESRKLADINQVLQTNGYVICEQKDFHYKMIFSKVYRLLD